MDGLQLPKLNKNKNKKEVMIFGRLPEHFIQAYNKKPWHYNGSRMQVGLDIGSKLKSILKKIYIPAAACPNQANIKEKTF